MSFYPQAKTQFPHRIYTFIIIAQKSTSQNVKAMKDKMRLRACPRKEEMKDNVGSCSGPWNRRVTLVETMVKHKVC